MSRRLAAAAVLVLSLAAGTAAQAQSYTAPAGIPAATAPGGATGYDAARSWTGSTELASDRLTTGSVSRTARVPAGRR